jgi:16S rRNA (cytidine1402-2'-O)-methyltransferase
VRRTAGDSVAARANSNDTRSRRDHPSRRSDASKPDRTTPLWSTEQPTPVRQGEGAGTTTALAPGLYLVATPVGNLADITLRALAVLRDADRIFCEDTRVTRKLLARYEISTPLETYHDHNSEQARPAILTALRRNARIALVSDAGTPLVSDPGYKLVRAAIAENLPVTAVPGPSAALAGLLLSGLPPDRFLYGGFLPPRSTARRRELQKWAAVEATLVFFESPQRLADSLGDIAQVLGDRQAAVARELTKLHEEVRRGRLQELADYYRDTGPPRGETVVVIGPPERSEPDEAEVEADLRSVLAEFGVRDAAAKIAAKTGLPRNELYRRALLIRGDKP